MAEPVSFKYRAFVSYSHRDKAWAEWLHAALEKFRSPARTDEATLEAAIPLDEINTELAQYPHPMIASLFERFGATGLSVDRVAAELERMKSSYFPLLRG